MEIAAKMAGTNREYLRQARKIQQTAKTNPEVAAAWEKVKQGQVSIRQVYQKVRELEKKT